MEQKAMLSDTQLMGKQIQSCSPEVWGGFECTINRIENNFFDQLSYSGHYKREGDIDAVAALGIRKLRYPLLWEKHEPLKDVTIDWTNTEVNLNQIKQNGIDVIAGLVHHGSGPAFTDLTDPNFAVLLSQYAKKTARKFPWIDYYTPVNEPLTTARFSGLYGLWYPHNKNARAFIQMLLNQVKGIVLSMKEIRKVNPQAQLVQTEDLCKIYSTPLLQYQADFENERRWLTYDLLCGKVDEDHPLWNYFKRLKIKEEDVRFFEDNVCIPQVFGFNHYITSERFLDERLHLYPEHTHGGNNRHAYADVEAARVPLKEENGMELLLAEAWQRYQQPMAITEVHIHCHREEQLRWFQHIWKTCESLKQNGINIKGVTAWALGGPGVFDVRSGELRPTALAHFLKKLGTESSEGHPVSSGEGWWQRSDRFLSEPKSDFKIENKAAVPPLLIIGKRGTLGNAFKKICRVRNLNFQILGRQECDISNLTSVEAAIEFYKPWAIINAAGYVQVDNAEREPEICFKENTKGSHNLAIACNKYGVKLVSFSSDLVFDGNKNEPYIESDAINPLNVYGKSKAQAEALIMKENKNALIIRTSAFFGPWDEHNFVYQVKNALSEFRTMHVVEDIFISPTYVPDLVNTVLDLLIDDEKGIWHLTNKGQITWAGFAHEIAHLYGLNKKSIIMSSTDEMRFHAPRPAYSVLGSAKGVLLPSLEDALHRYFNETEMINFQSKIA